MADESTVLLEEILGRLELLEAYLPRRIEAGGVFRRAKLPFHAVQCREVLAWRFAELAREAYEAIGRDRLAAAVLLTRAVMETAAAQWYLRSRVTKALDSGDLGNIKSCVHRLLLGSRTSEDLPDPINVLSFVDAVNDTVEGFRDQFDHLCEVAHPNWAGTSQLYSQPDAQARAVEFGHNLRGSEGIRSRTVANLSVAMAMFELDYNEIADLMDPFIELCERDLDKTV